VARLPELLGKRTATAEPAQPYRFAISSRKRYRLYPHPADRRDLNAPADPVDVLATAALMTGGDPLSAQSPMSYPYQNPIGRRDLSYPDRLAHELRLPPHPSHNCSPRRASAKAHIKRREHEEGQKGSARETPDAHRCKRLLHFGAGTRGNRPAPRRFRRLSGAGLCLPSKGPGDGVVVGPSWSPAIRKAGLLAESMLPEIHRQGLAARRSSRSSSMADACLTSRRPDRS
jgi:hypothetical protein